MGHSHRATGPPFTGFEPLARKAVAGACLGVAGVLRTVRVVAGTVRHEGGRAPRVFPVGHWFQVFGVDALSYPRSEERRVGKEGRVQLPQSSLLMERTCP